jgi:DNA-binding transcriptional LysR family regulator
MELRHLRGFMAVAQEQSFTRAAERLHMAQPPLSQRILELERELGVRLFDRHTRQVSLSAAGRAFLEGIEPVFAQLDQAAEASRRAHRGEAGRLRLGFTGRASHHLLPRLVQAFHARHPGVALDIEGPLATGPLKAALLNGSLDAALCFLPLGGDGIATRAFARSELALFLPAAHPLAGRRSVSLAALAGEPFVGYPANRGFHLREAMDAECQRAGFTPRVVRESEASQVLLCLIAAGAGVSVLPRELEALEEFGGVVLKPLRPKARALQHGLAWMAANRSPALVNLLAIA